MSNRADTHRSLPDRHHLGQQIRDARTAIGMNQRQLAAIAGIRQCSISYIENASRDILASTLVDAAAVGLNVTLAAEHHLPVLDLTAAEVDALVDAAKSYYELVDGYPVVRDALAKLAPPPLETVPSRPHRDEPRLDRPIVNVPLPA